MILETLAPAERLAFVLHDMFAVSFDGIAPIVERTPAAARQLASRARRRVQGAQPPNADLGRQRVVVDAFLAAARGGDFDALLAVLDPDVVLRSDRVAVGAAQQNEGAPKLLAAEIPGVQGILETFSGRPEGAQPATINGAAGAVWAPDGTPRMVFDFTIADGKILAISVVADPATLGEPDVMILGS